MNSIAGMTSANNRIKPNSGISVTSSKSGTKTPKTNSASTTAHTTTTISGMKMKTAPIASIYLSTTKTIVTFRVQAGGNKTNTGTGGTLTQIKIIEALDRIAIATNEG